MSNRGPVIQATATVLAALVGAGATIYAAHLGVLPPALIPPAATVTATVTAPPPDQEPAAKPSGSSAPIPARTILLDTLEPIDEYLETESVSWQENTFSHSLVNELSGCSARGPVIWEVPNGVSRFYTEIGVDTSSKERMANVSFNIYLDQSPVVSRTLPVGSHEPVSMELNGASTITLESIVDENRNLTCTGDAIAVWGDPRFE